MKLDDDLVQLPIRSEFEATIVVDYWAAWHSGEDWHPKVDPAQPSSAPNPHFQPRLRQSRLPVRMSIESFERS